MSPLPNRQPKPWKEYGRYGSVGIELVLTLLLGLWGGVKADAYFRTGPYLTLAGMALGAYAGFRVVWQVAKKMEADVDRAERRDRGEDAWGTQTPEAPTPPKSQTHDDGANKPRSGEEP